MGLCIFCTVERGVGLCVCFVAGDVYSFLLVSAIEDGGRFGAAVLLCECPGFVLGVGAFSEIDCDGGFAGMLTRGFLDAIERGECVFGYGAIVVVIACWRYVIGDHLGCPKGCVLGNVLKWINLA